LAHHPELKTLPFRRGRANRLDATATRELDSLGQELHLLLDRLKATSGEEQPSTILLGEFMKLETRRDKKATWLRPESVPTLTQVLGHEYLQLRLLQVELLTRIKGRAASRALAQRAIFDLSPEVRESAILSLDSRPREEYRSALVEALRYPWAPAADHAAEALVALKDSGALPLIARLLKEPDPTAPVARRDGLWKHEVVRINHVNNCMTCHAPSTSRSDPVVGVVPGFAAVKTGEYYGRGNPTSIPGLTDMSLKVRGDITYLRQDFSIQQPVRVQPTAQTVNLRFDYIVRFRPLTEKQAREWKAQAKRPDTYEQREAVLFALRELTGQDAGATAEAWEKLYPLSDFESWTIELTNALVNAPDLQKAAVIKNLRDAKGGAHTEALAQAIPQLEGKYQEKARAALVERMARMTAATLRDKLAEENPETRRAAASAVARKEEASLIPDLTELLDDPEPAVAEAAQASLKALGVKP
jgi:hypothetical protein